MQHVEVKTLIKTQVERKLNAQQKMSNENKKNNESGTARGLVTPCCTVTLELMELIDSTRAITTVCLVVVTQNLRCSLSNLVGRPLCAGGARVDCRPPTPYPPLRS